MTKLRQVYRDKSACKEVKAFMRANDPVAASEVIPRFKRKAGEHQSVEKPNGSCALNDRIKKLLDHVDWCHANRGGDAIYFDRRPYGTDVPWHDVRDATAKQIAAAKTDGPNAKKRRIKQVKKKGKRGKRGKKP